MKYASYVALFCGAAQAAKYLGEPVWSLRSVQDHRTDSQVQKAFGDHSTVQANGRPPYQSAIQVRSESESSESSDDAAIQTDFIGAHEHGKLDGKYERVVPSRFSGDADDIFMRSMISKYALEGQDKDDAPNGTFWMNEATARAAASEVLNTHKGLKGAALDSYLNTYFSKAWSHFDVNKTGTVEVIKMPQFMRFLASDQYMSLGE